MAQVRTNLVPQAAPPPSEITMQTGMKLALEKNEPIQKGVPFRIQILLRSEIDSIRLVSSQIKYDPRVLEILKIETPKTATPSAAFYATASAEPKIIQITHWLETLFDNKDGKASLTGLFDQADFKTAAKDPKPFLYATVIFKPKQTGETEIKLDNTSVMLRSADNTNILVKAENLKLAVTEATPGAQLNNKKETN